MDVVNVLEMVITESVGSIVSQFESLTGYSVDVDAECFNEFAKAERIIKDIILKKSS